MNEPGPGARRCEGPVVSLGLDTRFSTARLSSARRPAFASGYVRDRRLGLRLFRAPARHLSDDRWTPCLARGGPAVPCFDAGSSHHAGDGRCPDRHRGWRRDTIGSCACHPSAFTLTTVTLRRPAVGRQRRGPACGRSMTIASAARRGDRPPPLRGGRSRSAAYVGARCSAVDSVP